VSVIRKVEAQAPAAAEHGRGQLAALATRLNRTLFSTQRWPWFVADGLVVLVLYELGFRISPYGERYDEFVSPLFPLSLLFAMAFTMISLGLGSYDREDRFDYYAIARNAILAAALASGLALAVHYFALYQVIGRLTLAYGAAFALVGTIGLRTALAWAVQRHPYRFAVIGASGPIRHVLEEWARHERQARLYELVPWETIFADPMRPTRAELLRADIAEIVISTQKVSDQEAVEYALLGLRCNVPLTDERTFYTHLFERLPIDEVSKRWVLEQGLARPQSVVVAGKRLADIVISGIGLVLASPLLIAIAAAIRLTSPGPVLFVQERQGRFNEPFRMLKFRTMRHEPEAERTDFTQAGDDRVHRVGRLLRRTHLDELPQLWNILRGEMSLVGPRPESLEFARAMDAQLPLYELRYLVRPGLTGHAQLKQGYAMDTVLDTQAKLAYDLYYLCYYSMRLDIRILLRTALFLTRGAR
jgi:exopolysaccharide biosynthesis polyprenyl glycosylphosphotransferase